MGTVVEGDVAAILRMVHLCHEEARKHAARVLIELALDDREGRPNGWPTAWSACARSPSVCPSSAT